MSKPCASPMELSSFSSTRIRNVKNWEKTSHVISMFLFLVPGAPGLHGVHRCHPPRLEGLEDTGDGAAGGGGVVGGDRAVDRGGG